MHLAVVDPGVGSARRAVAVAAAEGRFLVGPDNGLLSRALDRLGGALDAVELSRSPFRLEPVSATFHGRDLFAPVAAHLSLGARLEEAGQSIDPASLVTLDLPTPEIRSDRVIAHAIHVDGYGNVTLDLDAPMLVDGPLSPGNAIEVRAPDGRFEASLGPDLRRCRSRRRAPLRGFVRGARAGGGRRECRGTDGSHARRRGHAPAAEVTGFGHPHRHFRRTDSTNERAKELAIAGAPGGLVVTADEQTGGPRSPRQRVVRAPGLLPALLGARSGHSPRTDSPLLPLAVPLAVCETAEAVAPVRCQVKWPNDIWIEERKVSGVLVEARPEEGWAVVGVGLNVAITDDEFPPELRATAISLLPTEAEEGLPPGGAPSVRRALAALNETLIRWLEAGDDEVLSAFRARDALCGRRISWDGGEGVAEEIDEGGHLVVEKTDGERVSLGAGEVHLAVES